MARKTQKEVQEQEGFRFQVKDGDQTITYRFKVERFCFDRLNKVEVSDLFDGKGDPKMESAAILQKLVKINSGIIEKEE